MSASQPAAERTASALGVWVLAARLPTLTAAAAPVFVGTGVAIHDDVARLGPALAALLGALAIQVGANLANDVSDFRRGADTSARIGPPRVTQLGLLSQRHVLAGMWAAFGVATLAGLYLVAVAGWPVVAVGLASIAAALAYTGGPWPFGYRGLGEVFTFVFFGLVAVVGTYFVQAEEVTGGAVAAAVPVGLTVSAILMVNNIRDIETDAAAGKHTLAVIIGRAPSRWLFLATLALAYAWPAGLWIAGDFTAWVLLAWLSLPLAVPPVRAVLASTEGPALNAALRATARLHLLLGVLLAVGLAV
jgi:1,4-dihydroxy-2-naphthoate octaprenyltransferase